jgi:hypothetical protein
VSAWTHLSNQRVTQINDIDYSGDQGPMSFIALFGLRVHTQPLPNPTESPPMSCFADIHRRRSRIQYSGAINE